MRWRARSRSRSLTTRQRISASGMETGISLLSVQGRLLYRIRHGSACPSVCRLRYPCCGPPNGRQGSSGGLNFFKTQIWRSGLWQKLKGLRQATCTASQNGIGKIHVFLVHFVFSRADRLTEALEVNDLAFPEEANHIVYIRIVRLSRGGYCHR